MIEQWLRTIRDHPARPSTKQAHALFMLSLRMDGKTKAGFASNKQLAKDAGVSESTIVRATRWAQHAGLLLRTRRGHRISETIAIASEWRLIQPVTGDTLAQTQSVNGTDPKCQQPRPKVSAETPHQDLSPSESSPSARALANAGATEDETREILRKIKNNPAVRNARGVPESSTRQRRRVRAHSRRTAGPAAIRGSAAPVIKDSRRSARRRHAEPADTAGNRASADGSLGRAHRMGSQPGAHAVSGQLIATRVMKARGESICPRCRCSIGVGVRIGLVLTIGWCHVVPCIVGGKAPMIGPSNEPSPKGTRP